jgi:hypothetical protein
VLVTHTLSDHPWEHRAMDGGVWGGGERCHNNFLTTGRHLWGEAAKRTQLTIKRAVVGGREVGSGGIDSGNGRAEGSAHRGGYVVGEECDINSPDNSNEPQPLGSPALLLALLHPMPARSTIADALVRKTWNLSLSASSLLFNVHSLSPSLLLSVPLLQGESGRAMEPRTNIGIDNLPNQKACNSLNKGFVLNLLVAGETAIGKSTLLNTLLHQDGGGEWPSPWIPCYCDVNTAASPPPPSTI